MPAEQNRSPSSRVEILIIGIACVALVYCGWSWFEFSGPFRLLVDAQLAVSGTYSETVSVVLLILAVVLTSLPGVVVNRRAHAQHAAAAAKAVAPQPTADAAAPAASGRSTTASDGVALLVVLVASAGGIFAAVHLWRQAEHMPRLGDPVRVVDVRTIGANGVDPVTQAGHVRLIGVLDYSSQVMVHNPGRTSGGSWDSWTGMRAQGESASSTPVRIVVTRHDPERAVAANVGQGEIQGLLLFDQVDTRTV